MQIELEKGASLDEIRNKITKGEMKTKATPKRKYIVERIQRKERDLMQLINKYVADSQTGKEKISVKPKSLTVVELYSETKKEEDVGSILSKKIFNLSGMELLVGHHAL